MMGLSIQLKASPKLMERLKNAPITTKHAIRQAVKDTAIDANQVIKRLIVRLFYSDGSRYHTGRLGRDDQFVPDFKNDGMSARLASNLIYAPVQEYGATIRKKSLYLTVPLSKEYAHVRVQYKNLRDAHRFYFIKSKKGTMLLMDKRNNRPAFVLKDTVTIPPKPYVAPTVEVIKPRFVENINKQMGKFFD